jgi:hypothetical protein
MASFLQDLRQEIEQLKEKMNQMQTQINLQDPNKQNMSEPVSKVFPESLALIKCYEWAKNGAPGPAPEGSMARALLCGAIVLLYAEFTAGIVNRLLGIWKEIKGDKGDLQLVLEILRQLGETNTVGTANDLEDLLFWNLSTIKFDKVNKIFNAMVKIAGLDKKKTKLAWGSLKDHIEKILSTLASVRGKVAHGRCFNVTKNGNFEGLKKALGTILEELKVEDKDTTSRAEGPIIDADDVVQSVDWLLVEDEE